MALFVNRNEQRSQYQEKLAADLKGKLNTSDIMSEKPDSTMLDDSHQTRPAGLIIAVLLLLIVVIGVAAMFLIG